VSDYASIQELGGSELARHYPDRGQIHDSNWYNAILVIETQTEGFLDWLRRLGTANNSFLAVLSADAEGLRIVVSLDHFAIYIPWEAARVSAERSQPATVVRLVTAAIPALTLVTHVDDDAADQLFRATMPPLARRDPPRRLFWMQPWLAWGLIVVVATLAVCVALTIRQGSAP
jgi:hypothetical protein